MNYLFLYNLVAVLDFTTVASLDSLIAYINNIDKRSMK